MAEKLTPQQEMAVNNSGGELLVSAAAGSGKTKVLVDRLLRYITDPVRPRNIDDFLIITYTKAAAAELRAKIASKLSERIAQEPENRHLQRQMQRLYLAKISTVHSFCADLLREYAYRLDIPSDFRVAEENECLELQARVMQDLLEDSYSNINCDPSFQALVDTQGLGRDDRQIPDIIYRVYNSAKCHLNPSQWLDWCGSVCNAEDLSDASETVWGRFLIEDLHKYLQLQISSLEKCVAHARDAGGLDKQIELLMDTVNQLKTLLFCKTWKDIHQHKDIQYGTLSFPRKYEDQELIDQIKAVRDECKSELAKKLRSFTDSNEQVMDDIIATKAATDGLLCLVKKFSDAYSGLKRRRRVMDFSDLEHLTLDLLTGKDRSAVTGIAREVGERFCEIMVDEYQDSNVVQDTIFKSLTQERHNCFMVGDVKQSIYQFRLADPGIFLEKYNQYVPAESAKPGMGRKVLLSSNFRSASSVINAVNDVFSLCMSPDIGGLYYGADEMLNEGIPHSRCSEPEVEFYAMEVQEDRYEEEASFVANRISELLDGTHFVRDGDELRPIQPDDIVILLRSPGSTGRYYENALDSKGIRFANGGNDDLLHAEEVEVLRALLQVINNPLEDIPLVATLSSRVFCFTADDLAEFRSVRNYSSIFHALREFRSEKTDSFVETLNALRKEAKLCGITTLLGKIFSATRMDSIYASLQDGAERIENLQAFCQIAASFETGVSGSLPHFLEYLKVLEERGVAAAVQPSTAGAVTIMSIHKSKGLEFPVVFLAGLSRKFSTESTKGQVLCDRDLGLGLSCVDVANRLRYPSIAKRAITTNILAQGISEEMRVLYVAMTRAKDRLIMTYSAQNLGKTLTGLVNRMRFSEPLLMTMDVNCPGKWILLTALQRSEAAELFSLAGTPLAVRSYENKWIIRVVSEAAGENLRSEMPAAKKSYVSDDSLARIRSGLSFVYPHPEATQAPSKQTATQLKGRIKDQEANQDAKQLLCHKRSWKRPSFTHARSGGITHGNAVHSVMQYICYNNCDSPQAVQDEIGRLVSQNFITQLEAGLVDPTDIAEFFNTEIGRKLRTHQNVLREFKFSILEDGALYDPNMSGERILLQGVIDCAMIDPDGIIILDFKSDRIQEDGLSASAEHYSMQLKAYANALSRIFELPVKSAMLYYFTLRRFCEIPVDP